MEDYATEILVGLIEANKEIFRDFAKNILEIPGDNFQIESQRRFNLKDDTDFIVDIVIENQDTICFLENKVNSSEGERQLERYSKVLNNIQKEKNKDIYLRYCTKYYDKKDIIDINFKQFRWVNVYRVLKKYENNKMIREFLEFLRGEDMVTAGNFNFQDLIVLANLNATFSKINECFDNLRSIFSDGFGKLNHSSTIKQIKDTNGCWLWRDNAFGEGYSEVCLGISLSECDGKIIPYLVVSVYCMKNNSKYDEFKKYIEKNEDFFEYIDIEDNRSDAWFEEPLSNFIASDNQFEEIEEWFIEKLDKLNEFRKRTPELEWNC
ncbi:PD-(D/E)XK nuclease family protein [Tepidibacter mesophilus]|uniref:PD-(D/E)XK nuclease family protein n=1 Tax=Tepidibacter mesophilus TaxID=655607 RepID=UPI0016513EDF|nr:PD-(D/E)XK nuclease family protein [Tepidibacter mesophilus]